VAQECSRGAAAHDYRRLRNAGPHVHCKKIIDMPPRIAAAGVLVAAEVQSGLKGIYMRCIDELLMATSERVNGRRGDFRPRFGTMLASGEAESGSAGTQPGEE
jgi:hypothetical protein